MEKGYHSEFFTQNIWLMKASGVWSFFNEDKSTKLLHIVHSLFWITVLEIYAFPVELYDIKFVYHQLDLLIGHVGVLMTHFLGNIKTIILFSNRKKLGKLMKDLGDSRFNYNFTDEYDPYETAEINNRTVRRTSTFFLGISTCVALARYVPSMVALMDYQKKNLTCDEILPVLLTLPFPTNSWFACCAAIHFQFIIITFYAYQIICSDMLYVSCIMCMKSHLSILQTAFQTIKPRCLNELKLKDDKNAKDTDNKALEKMMDDEMKKCSIHLQTILYDIEIVENTFNKIILMQTLTVVFMLVSCLYMMSMVDVLSSEFIGELIYLLALSTQVTLYCWFGNEISVAGSEIPTSIYSGDWFSASEGFKRSMLINMLRLNRDIKLTIGKFSPLTLETLVSIYKGSYTYFTVLKTMEQ